MKSRNEYLTYCSCQIIDITQLIDIQLNKSPIFSKNVADGRWQFIWGQGTRVKKMVKKLLIYIYIYILKFLSSTFRCRVENCHLPSAIIVPSQTILKRLTFATGKHWPFPENHWPLTLNVKKSPKIEKKSTNACISQKKVVTLYRN